MLPRHHALVEAMHKTRECRPPDALGGELEIPLLRFVGIARASQLIDLHVFDVELLTLDQAPHKLSERPLRQFAQRIASCRTRMIEIVDRTDTIDRIAQQTNIEKQKARNFRSGIADLMTGDGFGRTIPLQKLD